MQGPATVATRRWIKRAAIHGGLEAVSLAMQAGLFRKAAGLGAIFTLHHVRPAAGKSFDPAAHLSITPEFLDAAITRLKAAGYRALALADLPSYLADPDPGDRVMVFTLDDGYRDNALHARPVFEKHGVPFTVFVTAGFVDRTHSIWWKTAEALIARLDRFEFDFGNGVISLPTASLAEKYAAYDHLHRSVHCADESDFVARLDAYAGKNGVSALGIVDDEVMDDQELRTLTATPFASLGGHTISHPNLARVDAVQLEREITGSMARVGEITGQPVTTFAYPYGSGCAAGQREFDAARNAGLALAVTTRPDVLKPCSGDSLYALRRISLNGYYQQTRYAEALASGLPFAARGIVYG